MILSRVQMDNFLIIWYYIKGFKIYHIIKESKQKICSLIIERKHEKGKAKAIDLYCRLIAERMVSNIDKKHSEDDFCKIKSEIYKES